MKILALRVGLMKILSMVIENTKTVLFARLRKNISLSKSFQTSPVSQFQNKTLWTNSLLKNQLQSMRRKLLKSQSFQPDKSLSEQKYIKFVFRELLEFFLIWWLFVTSRYNMSNMSDDITFNWNTQLRLKYLVFMLMNFCLVFAERRGGSEQK